MDCVDLMCRSEAFSRTIFALFSSVHENKFLGKLTLVKDCENLPAIVHSFPMFYWHTQATFKVNWWRMTKSYDKSSVPNKSEAIGMFLSRQKCYRIPHNLFSFRKCTAESLANNSLLRSLRPTTQKMKKYDSLATGKLKFQRVSISALNVFILVVSVLSTFLVYLKGMMFTSLGVRSSIGNQCWAL